MARGANATGGYAASPNQESRYRALAEAFTSRGLDPQITTGGMGGIAQGLGGLAQAFTGKILADRADTKRTETVEKMQQQIAGMGLDPKYAGIASALTEYDPEAGLGFAADVITSPQAETWHTLTDEEARRADLDPSGQYKVSTSGNVEVITQPRKSELLSPDEVAQKLQIAAAGRSPGAPKPPPSLTERVWDTLINGDPNSPEYGLAFQEATKPQAQQGVNEQGQTIVTYITPELPPNIRRPSYLAQGTGTAPVASATAPQPAAGASGPRPGDRTAAGGVPGFSTSGPIVTGEASKRDQPLTEDQRKNTQLFNMSMQELPIAMDNFDALTDVGGQLATALPGGNAAKPENFQRAQNSAKTIARAYTYSVSGAQAPPQEVQANMDAVTPQFGDSPGTIKDKKNRLKKYVAEIATRAGITDKQPAAAKNPADMTDEELKAQWE